MGGLAKVFGVMCVITVIKGWCEKLLLILYRWKPMHLLISAGCRCELPFFTRATRKHRLA